MNKRNVNKKNIKKKDKYFFLLLLMIVVASSLVFINYLVGDKMYIFDGTGGDSLIAYWPFQWYMFDQIQQGTLPLWSFHLGLGTSILSILGYILEPFSLIPMFLDVSHLGNLFVYIAIIKIIIAGLLFYSFIGKIITNKYANMICALLYAFSGYMILWGQHYSFGTIMVYIPLLLLGFERWKSHKQYGVFITAIFLIAIKGVYVIYGISILLFIYAIFSYCLDHTLDTKESRKAFFIFTSKTIGIYMIGVGLACIILIPEIANMLLSPRIANELPKGMNRPFWFDYIAMLFRSLSPNTTIVGGFYEHVGRSRWWDIYEGPNLYIGLISFPLIVNILRIENKRIRKVYVNTFGLISILLLMPISKYIFNAFSSSNFRWTYIITVFFLIFTAKGFEEILNRGVNKKIVVLTGVFEVSVIGLALAVGYKKFGFEALDLNDFYTEIGISIIFIILYSLWLYNYKTFAKKKYYIFLTLLVFIEISRNAYVITDQRNVISKDYMANQKGYFDATIQSVEYIKSIDDSLYRIDKGYISQSLNDSLIQDYFGVKSYLSVQTPSYLNFIDVFNIPVESNWVNFNRGLKHREYLKNLIGVKYLLLKEGQDPPEGYTKINQIEDVVTYKNNNFIPFGYLYTKYIDWDSFSRLTDQEKDTIIYQAYLGENHNNNYQELESVEVEQKDQKILTNFVRTKDLEVDLETSNNLISYKVKGNDPYTIVDINNEINQDSITVHLVITTDQNTQGEVFWHTEDMKGFTKEKSSKFNLNKGTNSYSISIQEEPNKIAKIRLDIGEVGKQVELENIEIKVNNQEQMYNLEKTKDLTILKNTPNIVYEVNNNDPQLIFKLEKNRDEIDTSIGEYSNTVIDIEVTAEEMQKATIYWETTEKSFGFNETQKSNFNVAAGQHQYRVVLQENIENINSIRIDIGSKIDEQITINQIKIAPDRYIYNSDTIVNNSHQKGKFNITLFEEDKMAGEVYSNQPSMLFLAIPYDIGWKAKVNGIQTEIQEINGGFIGIPLETGKNEVILAYTFPLGKVGMVISVFSIIGLSTMSYTIRYKKQ